MTDHGWNPNHYHFLRQSGLPRGTFDAPRKLSPGLCALAAIAGATCALLLWLWGAR
jgi:hypothetical protein